MVAGIDDLMKQRRAAGTDSRFFAYSGVSVPQAVCQWAAFSRLGPRGHAVQPRAAGPYRTRHTATYRDAGHTLAMGSHAIRQCGARHCAHA